MVLKKAVWVPNHRLTELGSGNMQIASTSKDELKVFQFLSLLKPCYLLPTLKNSHTDWTFNSLKVLPLPDSLSYYSYLCKITSPPSPHLINKDHRENNWMCSPFLLITPFRQLRLWIYYSTCLTWKLIMQPAGAELNWAELRWGRMVGSRSCSSTVLVGKAWLRPPHILQKLTGVFMYNGPSFKGAHICLGQSA